ncbi:RNA-binding S4 domain-containing protein [Paracraurococcus ruber]|uniref:Heat-shock protein n=1 Tax=Paracraurococcus ruber TaxID=77675 RepID=A0ABS1D5Q3_9PROT|nr:RNA-binding S4 domain-containing protein [Paracraurococcus ruber]MBK1662213.1 heat-shock protein [Paracraurococcus ruber]TDG14304.1 RNA-binding S4 domain-containing protein [Paracraurococcus ruber]
MAEAEDRDWQRLDKWLWCARVAKTRAACARLVEAGGFRVNRQPTDKPHAKLRPGDVLTFALGSRGDVRIWQVVALGLRRGPAPEAAGLYQDLSAGLEP